MTVDTVYLMGIYPGSGSSVSAPDGEIIGASVLEDQYAGTISLAIVNRDSVQIDRKFILMYAGGYINNFEGNVKFVDKVNIGTKDEPSLGYLFELVQEELQE